MSSHNDSIAGSAAGIAILVIAVLVLLVWLLARASRTIGQAWIAHPTHKAIWTAAGLVGLLLLAALLTNGDPTLLALAAAAFYGLYLVSYVICVRDHDRFEIPWQLSDVVRPQSWWAAA